MGQALTGIPGRFPGAWRMALCAALFCAVLILSSNTASAVTNPPPPTPQTSHQGFSVSQVQGFFTDGYGDPLTSLFLHQIFGPLFPDKTRPGTSSSTSTVFSEIIGYFNIVAIGLGGLLFAWNATVGLLQTAHEGELLGRKWSSLWAPLRIVFAVGLLVPLPNLGGYNAAQAAIAYIVRGSTMTASFIWEKSAELMLDHNVAMAVTLPSIPRGLMEDMYAIAACEKIIRNQVALANDKSGSSTLQVVRERRNVQLTSEISQFKETIYLTLPRGNRIEVCGSWETPTFDNNIVHFLRERGIVDGSAAKIGQLFKDGHKKVMDYINEQLREIVDKKADVIMSANWQTQYPPSHANEVAVIYDLTNGALFNMVQRIFKEVAEGTPQGTANDDVIRANLSKDLLKKAMTGDPGCKTVAGTTGATNPVMANEATRHRCYGEGWIGAGKWYLALARINKSLNAFSNHFGKANYVLDFGSQREPVGTTMRRMREANPGRRVTWEDQQRIREAKKAHDQASRYLHMDTAQARMGAFTRAFRRDLSALASQNSGASVDPQDIMSLISVEGDGLTGGLTEWLLDAALGKSVKDVVDFMTFVQPSEDPLLRLMEWGDYFFIATGVATLGLLVAPGSGVLAAVMGALWGAGALLSIILPMMPWILWVIAVTGYFLVVVEAVLAVSLWAFAHLRMDGEGISGPASAGWTMILALLLMPILMVMGYLIGMVIYRVTSTLLMSGIWPTFHVALADATVLTQLLALPALGLLVGIMQVILIERSFSLTTELPNRVLNWIGAKADLYDSGALDRARIGMLGATAAVSKVGPGLASGAGGLLHRGLGRLRDSRRGGSARRGGEGTDQ